MTASTKLPTFESQVPEAFAGTRAAYRTVYLGRIVVEGRVALEQQRDKRATTGHAWLVSAITIFS